MLISNPAPAPITTFPYYMINLQKFATLDDAMKKAQKIANYYGETTLVLIKESADAPAMPCERVVPEADPKDELPPFKWPYPIDVPADEPVAVVVAPEGPEIVQNLQGVYGGSERKFTTSICRVERPKPSRMVRSFRFTRPSPEPLRQSLPEKQSEPEIEPTLLEMWAKLEPEERRAVRAITQTKRLAMIPDDRETKLMKKLGYQSILELFRFAVLIEVFATTQATIEQVASVTC